MVAAREGECYTGLCFGFFRARGTVEFDDDQELEKESFDSGCEVPRLG